MSSKFVNRRTFYQTRMKADGTEYQLYSYEVIDEIGNKEVIDSIHEFNRGDRVETFFNDTYNKPQMRLYKKRRK